MIKTLAKDFKVFMHRELFRAKWKKKNKHNYTTVGEYFFNIENVSVGRYTYGTLNVVMFSDKSKLKIGEFCSIASNVSFIVSGEHNLHYLSTYPFKRVIGKKSPEAESKGDIIINDDVWFGYGATILSGVVVGQGSIIAAGSVVTKDVPPYSIVAGVPAKVLGYRFNDKIRKEICNFNYSSLNKDNIMNNSDLLYREINEENVNEIINKLRG